MKDDQLMQMLSQTMEQIADDNFSKEVINKLSNYQTLRARFVAFAAVACALMLLFFLPVEFVSKLFNSMGSFYQMQFNLAEYWIPLLIMATTFWLVKTEEA